MDYYYQLQTISFFLLGIKIFNLNTGILNLQIPGKVDWYTGILFPTDIGSPNSIAVQIIAIQTATPRKGTFHFITNITTIKYILFQKNENGIERFLYVNN